MAVGDRPDAANVTPERLRLINGKKRQRLLFDPLLQRISREIGKEQIAKRSRMRGDEDIQEYFDYQLRYLINKNKPLLDKYSASGAIQELVSSTYSVTLDALAEKWKLEAGLLPELFVIQNIITRAFEKLLLADRILFFTENGACVRVAFIPGSPRNTVLVVSK